MPCGPPPAGGTPGEEDTLPSGTPRPIAARPLAALEHLALALAAFLPQLLTQPGVVDADTKIYLYLDPGRYLRQSLSMWDPTVGLGTVTHQQIGYVYPMGPFFWATHGVGVPTWVAERLWLGLILLAAGSGVWWLARLVGLGGPGRLVASTAYMLSPYTLQYIGHISVILLAFAALPWLVVLVDRAATGSWRAVAAVALVVAAMGSVNASSAIYVGVGPLLWLAASGLTGRHRWRALWRALWRCTVAAVVVSAWWIAGLLVEGGFGIDVLRYTETVQAVSTSSLASEVLRGLGYWYFYGGDNLGPWVSAMPQFTQELWLLAVGYVTPLLAVAATVSTRWRHRAVFLAMTFVGLVLAVGAHPFADPSPVGRLLRAVLQSGTVGLALRSTDRATPLVLLGLAALLGAGVSALSDRAPGPGLLLAGVAVGAVVASNPTLWNGTSVPNTFTGVKVAGYERQAAEALDRSGGASAVLGVPGQNFASTFVGTTVDPVWPALLTRPFVTREEQVMGSPPTEDLLYALDDPIQQGVADPAALVSLARLMGVGDLLVQNDLRFTRYDQPDPAVLWASVSSGRSGLGLIEEFGPKKPPLAPGAVVDEQTYTLPSDLPLLPALAVVPVSAPRPLVRAEATRGAMAVDGDGVGLEDVAETGLLSGGSPAVVYAGTLDDDAKARGDTLRPGATLVVTDTNRRQAFRWDNLTDVAGATLAEGQPYPSDPDDRPLDIFPGAPDSAQTTTAVSGVASVTASAYGNPFQYLAEDRPVEAIDGDPNTAWQVGPFEDPDGQWWQVELDAARTVGSVTILQPQNGPHDQWITEATLTFDGHSPLRVALGPASRRGPGQVITFAARRFRTLRIRIDATNVPASRVLGGGISAVGLAEVGIGAVTATEDVVMPTDLLRTAGQGSLADRLLLVMTRLRVAAATSSTDPETALVRTFSLPTARTFTLTGQARIDSGAPDQLVDELVGRSAASGDEVRASSSGRLQGDVADTASAALDGVPGAWSSPMGDGEQVGQWVSVDLPSSITFDQLHLRVVVDGRHSVPSELRVSAGGRSAVVRLPKMAKQHVAGASDPVTVSFPPLAGSTVRVTVLAIRPLRDDDYLAGGNLTLPVAIAQLGIPGVHMDPPPLRIPAPCRTDLLRVDGKPVPITVSGTSAAALSNGLTPLSVSLCGADAGGLHLGPGTHELVASPGRLTGLDLDQIVLDSAAGGGAEPGDGASGVVAVASAPAPAVHVVSRDATTIRLRVTATGSSSSSSPFWLVLGESLNPGWQATVVDGPALGAPRLVDGFANGWLVPAAALSGRRSLDVVLHWAPQGGVDVALVASLAGGVLALVVALWPRRRRPAWGGSDPAGAEASRPVLALPSGLGRQADGTGAGRRPPGGRVAAAALASGLLGAMVTTPAAGLAIALGVGACALARRGRLVLAVGAVAAVAATAITMVAVEAAGGYPGDGGWPAHFAAAAVLTWLALVLAVAETFVRARHGRSSGGTRPAGPTALPPPSPPT